MNKIIGVIVFFSVLVCPNNKKAYGANYGLNSPEKTVIVNRFLASLSDLYALNGEKLSESTIRELSCEIEDDLKLNSHLVAVSVEAKRKVKEILEIICSMYWLKNLAIKNCELDVVPEGIANLTELKSLDLSGNKLYNLPSSLAKLKKLQYLWLTDNSFETVPMVVQNLPLESLFIDKSTRAENLKLGFVEEPTSEMSDQVQFTSLYNKIVLGFKHYSSFFNLIYSDLPIEGLQSSAPSSVTPLAELVHSIIFSDKNIEARISERYVSKSETNNNEFLDWKKIRSENTEIYTEGPDLFLEKGHYTIIDPENSQKTESVTISEDIPIAYAVLLPKSGMIKAVMVKTYGGGLWQIPFKRNLDEKLLQHDIAIVFVNALDIYALKEHQNNINKNLYELLHLSINKVFKSLKKPEQLGVTDGDLSYQLKTRKAYLFGTSFGGGVAVRYGQLYPRDFAAVISFNGDLDFMTTEQVCSLAYRKIYDQLNYSSRPFAWLDPSRNDALEQLARPVLVIQNIDDNTIGFQTASSFRAKGQALGKAIEFLYFPKGNAAPKIHSHYKGHFPPTCERFIHGLLSFMLNTTIKSFSGNVQDWQIDLATVYTDGFINYGYQNRPLKEKFLSWALRFHEYKKLKVLEKSAGGPRIIHPSWEAFAVEGFDESHIYDALALVEDLLSKKQPLTFTETGLPDSVIINMLNFHIPLYLDYINELYDTNLLRGPIVQRLLADSSFIQSIRDTLLDQEQFNRGNGRNMLMRNLYLFNPSLLDNFKAKMVHNSDYQQRKQVAQKQLKQMIAHFEQEASANPAYYGPTRPTETLVLPARSEFVEKLRSFCGHYKDLATTSFVHQICKLADSDTLEKENWFNRDICGVIWADLDFLKTGEVPNGVCKNIYDLERKDVSPADLKRLENILRNFCWK